MATATAVLTPNKYNPSVSFGSFNSREKCELQGTLAIGASPAYYVTNGLPLTFSSNESIKSLTTTPQFGIVDGVSGYLYAYDPVHDTVRIYQSAGSTPAGTIASTTTITPAFATITATAETNAVVTALSANSLSVGEAVLISATTNSTWLNGQLVTLATGTNSTQLVFTDLSNHANKSNGADTGSAAGFAVATVSTFTGSALSAGAMVELTNGTAIPSGVSGDTIYASFTFPANF